ncbi:FlgD immunoglobulin-like domain containing protein [candidate division KSB1 bacterium]
MTTKKSFRFGVFFIVTMSALLAFLLQPDSKEAGDSFDSPSDAMNALNFWTAQRAYPHGAIPGDAFYKAYEETHALLLNKGNRLNAPDMWETIGPKNRGGRTIALEVDPNDPNIVYAGAATGGLWRLTITTATDYLWEYIDTGYPVLGVNSIVVDQSNSDNIIIGTGEVYAYQNSNMGLYSRLTRGSYGIGLLKTTDGGSTWTKPADLDWSYEQERGVLALEINPLDPDKVFAGTTEGTYKTLDGGLTWTLVHSKLMAVDIEINPVDTNIVYVSCGNLNSPESAGIYRSTDSGETWQKKSTGLPSDWGGKTLLNIYKAQPNIIYADVADALEGIGLYRSANNGDSWSQVLSHDHASYQGWFAHYVRVNPADNSKIISAGVNYYVSSNGGTSFSSVSGMHVDHHAFADHPTDPETVFFGNDGGVYRSTDGGYTFDEMNDGYITAQFYNGFSSSFLTPDLALGGLQDNGTIMYTGSLDWVKGVMGGDGAFTAINTVNDKIMYASSQNLNFSRSTNGGEYWRSMTGSFTGDDACFIAPYFLCESQPWIMYAGEDIIYKTENSGENWAAMNHGEALNGNAICAIGLSPVNPDYVYAATVPKTSERAEVFGSTDGGITWTDITGTLPDRYYIDLIVSPHSEDVVYISLSGFGSSHLYRSEDAGLTWVDIDGGLLPDVPTNAVAIDPQYHEHIYVGNDLGVYVSTDYGATWSVFSDQMPTAVIVMDLSISPSNGKIRAVTHGNGVYERTLLPGTVAAEEQAEAPKSNALGKNYPNPFNPVTRINFTVADPSYVTIKVYDMTGREVRTLTANGYPAGDFTVDWDSKNNFGNLVASGTYFYQMKVGNTVNTKRMTLVR